MAKRIGGFVEKLLYTIVAYIHMNISPKKNLCQFALCLWNLIVFIGRKFTADPVYSPRWSKQDGCGFFLHSGNVCRIGNFSFSRPNYPDGFYTEENRTVYLHKGNLKNIKV